MLLLSHIWLLYVITHLTSVCISSPARHLLFSKSVFLPNLSFLLRLMSVSLCFHVAYPHFAWRTPCSTRFASNNGFSLSVLTSNSPAFTLILALGIKFSVGSYFPWVLSRYRYHSVVLRLPVPGESFAVSPTLALVQVISTFSLFVKFFSLPECSAVSLECASGELSLYFNFLVFLRLTTFIRLYQLQKILRLYLFMYCFGPVFFL